MLSLLRNFVRNLLPSYRNVVKSHFTVLIASSHPNITTTKRAGGS